MNDAWFKRLRVLGHIIGQKLKGNEVTERRVLSLIDHAHPTTVQFLNMR
jgi:hypothetical protein